MLFFRRQTAGEVLTYFVYAPLLVLVFLGFCRLLFGKSPLCKQKKQCSRRTTKHNFGCAFFFVRLRVCCSRTSCTLRYACSPFAIFNACSAPDYLFVSNTLRSSSSSFSAFAVCSLARHLFASKKAVFKTHNQAQLRLCFFLCQAVGEVLTYLCTFRSLSSPSSTCAPCSAFGQRLARDNNSATHARLSRFSAFALRPIISLFQTRSAPRSRLSRLLPFALWQVTSLQAKKQCSRRTTKARHFIAVLFDIKSVDKRCVFRLLFYIRGRV